MLVSQHLSGLSANTTYHWRVVATNSIGTTEGQDHTFVYQPPTSSGVGCPNEQLRVENALSLLLPDCRAYEQVSPVDKNDSDVKDDFEGETTSAGLGGRGTGLLRIRWRLPRVAGWRLGCPVPRLAGRERVVDAGGRSPADGDQRLAGIGEDEYGYSLPLSPDLSTGAHPGRTAACRRRPGPEIWNLYVGNLLTGSYQLVTDISPPHERQPIQPPQGASTDFSHVIFWPTTP